MLLLCRHVVYSLYFEESKCRGSHASWKVLDFFCKISRPWKVLENGFGPGKSWNFLLGYDVGGRHNGVGVGAAVYNANSCDKFSDNLFAISQ